MSTGFVGICQWQVDEGLALAARAALRGAPNSITDGKRGGRRFAARAVVLRCVRLGARSARVSQHFPHPGRRTSVLPPAEGGRPTFDPVVRQKAWRNALELRRGS